jgi:hypothetical protein
MYLYSLALLGFVVYTAFFSFVYCKPDTPVNLITPDSDSEPESVCDSETDSDYDTYHSKSD